MTSLSASSTPGSTTTSGCPRRCCLTSSSPSRTSSSAWARAPTALRPRALWRRSSASCSTSSPTSCASAATSTRRSPSALAAAKLGIPIAHVEAGLRSFDWTMPEEINRVLTDRLSDLLFTHSPEAAANLAREGIDPRPRSLRRQHDDRLAPALRVARRGAHALATPGARARRVRAGHAPPAVERRHGPAAAAHRRRARRARGPARRVDLPRPPAHRRSGCGRRAALELGRRRRGCMEPLGYLDFLGLQIGAGAIVTDSGGVQEEAAALGVPCFTLRPNTERPVTISQGTNILLGEDPAADRRHPATPARAPRGPTSRAGTATRAAGGRGHRRGAASTTGGGVA